MVLKTSDVLARIKSHALSAVNAADDTSADEDAVKEVRPERAHRVDRDHRDMKPIR